MIKGLSPFIVRFFSFTHKEQGIMKKILLILAVILLCVNALPQNADKTSRVISQTEAIWRSFETTAELLRTKAAGGYTIKIDSLKYADSIKTFYFNGNYIYGMVTISDSTGGSGLVDSVVLEVYDTISGKWTTNSIGVKDLLTGDISSGTLVPGDNTVKRYLINDPYPRTIRLRRTNVHSIIGRVTKIAFVGKG